MASGRCVLILSSVPTDGITPRTSQTSMLDSRQRLERAGKGINITMRGAATTILALQQKSKTPSSLFRFPQNIFSFSSNKISRFFFMILMLTNRKTNCHSLLTVKSSVPQKKSRKKKNDCVTRYQSANQTRTHGHEYD